MDVLERNIGYTFKNKAILSDALTHSSIKSKNNKFEQMEFLGDRILNMIVSSIIVGKSPDLKAGELSSILSFLISYKTCCLVAQEIHVPQCIRTSIPSLKSNESVLADSMEAIVAAIFLDSDYETTQKVVSRLWAKHIDSINKNTISPKSKLQEITQSINNSLPKYEILSITGPDHKQEFSVKVFALGKEAIGIGCSKKSAETSAALKMIKILK